MIGMFDSTPSSPWTILSASNGAFYHKFIKCSDTYGITGGTETETHTHTHTNLVITTGGPSTTIPAYTPSANVYVGSGTHTHTVTVSFSTENHLPPYIDVIFAKYSLPVPSAPQNLRATPGNSQATLTWETPASQGGAPITNYKVYRGVTPDAVTTLVATPGIVYTYTDTGVTNGQTYYYRVSAVSAVGEGPKSNLVVVTPRTVPGEPQNLQITSGDTKVTLTWDAPLWDGGSPITNYKIYRGTTPNGAKTLVAQVGVVYTYTDTGLTNSRTYYYQVAGVNAAGEGAKSTEASVYLPLNLLLFYDGETIPPGWTLVSGNGGMFYQRFPRGSSAYGTIGGKETHTHTQSGILHSAFISPLYVLL